MIQKPSFVLDNQIIAHLYESYGLNVKTLQFLPVGEASWCYKAIEANETTWFIKIARHNLDLPSVTVPALLHNKMGYCFVVPAIPDKQSLLWTSLAQHSFVVYPYLQGKTIMDGSLFERWQEVGNIFAMLHSTKLPDTAEQMLKAENFIPVWGHEAQKVVRYATAGLVSDADEITKQHALQEFYKIFAPDDVVQEAYDFDGIW